MRPSRHQSRKGASVTKRFLTAAVLVAAIAAAFASSAAANHSWGTYHWARTANPFTIQLGDNLTTNWDPYLAQASSDWSADTAGNPLNTTVVAGSTSQRKCRPTRGRVEVCNAAYGNNGWLGVAQIWISGGSHITQGTTKMNDTYYNSPFYNTPVWRAMVVCQEVGHTFGLDHQDESGADFHTCMDYANNPDADNTHPNRHDYEQLATIYSHLDSTSTIGLAPAGLAGREGHAGRVSVARSDRISSSTIVERFSDGSARVTEIVWALA
jgi:hypothetical protein